MRRPLRPWTVPGLLLLVVAHLRAGLVVAARRSLLVWVLLVGTLLVALAVAGAVVSSLRGLGTAGVCGWLLELV